MGPSSGQSEGSDGRGVLYACMMGDYNLGVKEFLQVKRIKRRIYFFAKLGYFQGFRANNKGKMLKK